MVPIHRGTSGFQGTLASAEVGPRMTNGGGSSCCIFREATTFLTMVLYTGTPARAVPWRVKSIADGNWSRGGYGLRGRNCWSDVILKGEVKLTGVHICHLNGTLMCKFHCM